MEKIIVLITLLIAHVYASEGISLMQGQEANLNFPYPCDSTEVTLQQSNRRPFYSSTGDSSLSLPDSQVQRFKVKNIINSGRCSLDLTIRDLMRDDQGTYILFAYKDGNILHDDTHRVWLQVDYPPGKESCGMGDDEGGDGVEVENTANAGSLPGKIKCYEDGLWIPPSNEPIETDSLKQKILNRKSEPAFCCSSTLDEYKSRCECKDTVLFEEESSHKDPCPTITTQTTCMSIDSEYRNTDMVEITPTTYPLSTLTSVMKKTPYYVGLIILSCFILTLIIISVQIANNNLRLV
ncbi:uncharacterized protein LOC121422890 [Lytechinus variegatus]|uniref:uncharacterized protein LOC121422890 n=1 Tax=Lytechinus variegatus TaxID=7654 RepID=UPI001BB13862|nr:uncharacterized protein LOC121422890 [Lytechinus variegatus]